MASTLQNPEPPSDLRIAFGFICAEQRFFELSPFGVWLTSGLLYATLVGLYALAAIAEGRAWIVHGPGGPSLAAASREALVLALIGCIVLALQRYSYLKERQDAPSLARLLPGGTAWAVRIGSPIRLRLMSLLGAGLSAIAVAIFLPRSSNGSDLPTGAWFAVMSVLLSVLFFRGVELTRLGAQQAASIVPNLRIDLLRIDQLYPWGRAAARTSLIWFTVSAAICLLFVGGEMTIYTVFLLLGCAAIGVWAFVGDLSQVHRRIREVKAAALEDLRTEIGTMKDRLHQDREAPAKLQSLLAYEARIAAAPEWPFDQTILVRVGASALILTVPWFGQAFAGLVVEHFGKAMQ